MKEIYGFLAYPAKHSLSPLIHNTGFKALGLNAEYKIFNTPPAKLNDFLDYVRHDHIKGLNVSKPYKETIMSLLDEVDGTAKFIGAVNTIINKDGKLKGTNVDWVGVYEPISELIDMRGKSAVVLGAGGACRSAIYALQEGGVNEIVVLNRTSEKAETLASEFNCAYGGSIKEIHKFSPNIIVQGTSAGLNNKEGVQLIDPDFLHKEMVVFEMIYSPLETRLVRDARSKGCMVITGEQMLLHQAYKGFELWTGTEAPRKEMSKAVADYFSSL